MKGIDIFCASQAATAICFSMEEGSSSASSSSTFLIGSGRAIDRYNPIIRDPRRFGRTIPSCSSESPVVSPRLINPQGKNIKSQSSKINNEVKKRKKSAAKSSRTDEKRKSNVDDSILTTRKGWNCPKPGDFISPPGSSRYLLSEQAFLNVISDFDPVLKLVPVESSTTAQVVPKKDEFCPPKPSSSSRSPDQVVVLRVSLHCRGCERKMRKHLSRMEGVSSFNIDFTAKKVTVVGNVTPLSVLNSISKVKNAQLWTPPTTAAAAAAAAAVPVHQNNSEIKKPVHENISEIRKLKDKEGIL